MSDHSISVVPRNSNYYQNKVKAEEILEWLISEDIVKAKLSDCILSSDKGYAISEGAKQITNFPNDLPYDLIFNGLEIITTRQVFDTGESGIEKCICSNCDKNIAEEDWSFFDEWAANKSNNLICPLCKVAKNIHEFKFTPEWGFSDLGFRFWNWPDLNNNFINEFQKRLDCDVSVVYQHI